MRYNIFSKEADLKVQPAFFAMTWLAHFFLFRSQEKQRISRSITMLLFLLFRVGLPGDGPYPGLPRNTCLYVQKFAKGNSPDALLHWVGTTDPAKMQKAEASLEYTSL